MSKGPIPENRRCCWNCLHCAKWTMYPDDWVGACMGVKEAADHCRYVDLPVESCGYFELRLNIKIANWALTFDQ